MPVLRYGREFYLFYYYYYYFHVHTRYEDWGRSQVEDTYQLYDHRQSKTIYVENILTQWGNGRTSIRKLLNS